MITHIILFIFGAALAFLSWRHWHVVSPLVPADTLRLPLLAGFAGLALWQMPCAYWAWRDSRRKPRTILRMGGFAWNTNDFCRGWLITGETGSGKNPAVINNMLWQVTQNCPNWGGICIDDKGLYWETLSTMFRALGREKDLILIKVRPADAPAGWKPEHTFNFLEDPRLPFSSKAKDVCDVAASLGQDRDQPFFKTQAEIQMDFAFRALACADVPVTLDNAHELLASDAWMKQLLRKLENINTPEAESLMEHHRTQIATQPAEQLGGVRGTLANRLKHFTSPDIAEVFCPDKSTFSISEIDRGTKKYKKRSYSYSGGKRTVSHTDEEKYYIEPHEFRRLRKFEAVVQHCELGFRKVKLTPRGADGNVPGWFH